MTAIDRKAFRDLWKIKGQALAIALVIASGVAMYIMSISNFESLRHNQRQYYDRYRFGDVFAGAKRAPHWLATRIAAIPGVRAVETRVVAGVTLDVEGMSEPVVGQLISVSERGDGPVLNGVALLEGRMLVPGRPDEVLAHENFALAHDMGPGDRVTALINGRRRDLTIVGVVLSPEYIYTVRPGDLLPDNERYGIFWMNRKALATAFDMEGGFNDVSLTLMPGASAPEVIARLDRLLEPYGGRGAIPRALQVSHWWVNDQLNQLEQMGKVVPVLFLGVGALLLTVVLNRIVTVQRGQIAALKALGYSSVAIGRHYLLWGVAICAVGGAIGVATGIWLGREMLDLQGQFYRFPTLDFRVSGATILGALAISLLSALVGAVSAVRRAVSLPPAEAMRPEPPGHFKATLVERLGLGGLLTEPARMILRSLERRPWRAVASIVGIGLGGAIMIVGMFSLDGMDEMLEIQFNVAQRQDITVTFVEPLSAAAGYEIARLPGVVHSEPLRAVPAMLRYGHRSRQTAITGVSAGARLNRVIDASLRPVRLQEEGLILSDKLARLLGAVRGDVVTVEVLEGARPVRRVVVSDVVEEYMGMSAYMELDALRRMMREGDLLSGAFLQVDDGQVDELYSRLKALPAVAGVTLKKAAVDSFNATVKDMLAVSIAFNVLFAAIIAFGVVYNTARITLSERSHELASLRVLGFTRAEISFILLGELAIITLISVPVGLLFGYGLAALTVSGFETEVYRIPLLVSPRVYAYSAITVLVSAAISSFVVRRRLDTLDLIEVLKTRE
jgi:putative ABC transport system permease protein